MDDDSRIIKVVSPRELLVLQVRGFLDAAEDVDIDDDVFEDLIQTISGSEEVHLNSKVDANELSLNSTSDEESSTNGAHLSEHDLLLSALYVKSEAPDEPVWTKQEVKHMLHFLRERGMVAFVKEYVFVREIPIPKLLHAFGVNLSPELLTKRLNTMLYFLKVALSRELRIRDKLPQYNSVEDAIELIRRSKRILILTGAGISVSCGIPDFRSRDGLYASLKDKANYDLDDPQQMFDIHYFKENPSVFYSFASQIYPSNFTPSPCHRFIKLIEEEGKLLRNYTQNIDTLETLAGVQRVLQCHGSFATASCLLCQRRVPGTEIEQEILTQRVPICSVCSVVRPAKPLSRKRSKKRAKGEWDSQDEDDSDGAEFPAAIMKPDITFFGEKLTGDFDKSLAEDREKVDLLLVMGTSLKVSPVADILSHLPHSVPQILVNKTPIRHINPDIILLGNADEIVRYLTSQLGWDLPPPMKTPPQENKKKKRTSSPHTIVQEPQRVANSHVWLFEGAEGGRWLTEFERRLATEIDIDSAHLTVPTPAQKPTSSLLSAVHFSDPESDSRKPKRTRLTL